MHPEFYVIAYLEDYNVYPYFLHFPVHFCVFLSSLDS